MGLKTCGLDMPLMPGRERGRERERESSMPKANRSINTWCGWAGRRPEGHNVTPKPSRKKERVACYPLAVCKQQREREREREPQWRKKERESPNTQEGPMRLGISHTPQAQLQKRQTDRQADRQTDRQRQTETDRDSGCRGPLFPLYR